MKKVSIFMAIAAAASLASCTAQAPKANLKSDIDSLSYSIGMAQTQGLKGYLTGRLDVDTAYMAEFIKGLNEGANKTSISTSDKICVDNTIVFVLDNFLIRF